jgi:hypothetical protein
VTSSGGGDGAGDRRLSATSLAPGEPCDEASHGTTRGHFRPILVGAVLLPLVDRGMIDVVLPEPGWRERLVEVERMELTAQGDSRSTAHRPDGRRR